MAGVRMAGAGAGAADAAGWGWTGSVVFGVEYCRGVDMRSMRV